MYLYICISVFGEGALVLLVCSQHALLSGQGWIPPTYILLDALGSLQKKNYTVRTFELVASPVHDAYSESDM